MNEKNLCTTISPYSSSGIVSGFVSEMLSAVPSALAKPILDYQKTKAQKELISIAIEARRRERTEILRTMQILAKYGQLTPELSQHLVTAYYQLPVLL